MVKRNPKNRLERWEVALVKAMLAKGTFGNDQDILAYFTRPTRSINHARICDIRDGRMHAKAKPATPRQKPGRAGVAHFGNNQCENMREGTSARDSGRHRYVAYSPSRRA